MTIQFRISWLAIEFLYVSIAFLFITSDIYSQNERFEVSASISYAKPQMEAWGNDVYFDPINQIVTVSGNRIVNSNNLGMNYGFAFEAYGKIKILKEGKLKGIINLGYTQLENSQQLSTGLYYGVKMPVLSFGAGIEANPLGTKKLYPSAFALFRVNEISGESFYNDKLDYFPVSTRMGYVIGLKLNYRVSEDIAINIGSSFSYDNLFIKQNDPGSYSDPHESNFVDQPNTQIGLNGARRIGYINIDIGVNYYIK